MTRRPTRTALVLLVSAALAVAGCDWLGGGGSSADTRMRNVEILPGTASDEMVTLDSASSDGTAVDTSVAAGPPAPAAASDDAADGETADGDTPVAGDDEPETRPGDTVIRPPASTPAPK